LKRNFASRPSFAKHVETDAGNDGREPSREVVDSACATPHRVDESLLNRILCLGLGAEAEHAVGHRPEMASMGFEALRQSFWPAHRHISMALSVMGMTATEGERDMTDPSDMVSVRYMVDDVEASVAFYTKFLGFRILNQFLPFADVARGKLRLLLSGPASSAGRPMPDGVKPVPGGWNRIHLIVEDIEAEVRRLRDAGVSFRNDIVEGPGGKQILLQDPSGNVIELFQSANAGG
jgi:catechol 2,3-dioxygenase-like lactoylglutathione lyase family enzyme